MKKQTDNSILVVSLIVLGLLETGCASEPTPTASTTIQGIVWQWGSVT